MPIKPLEDVRVVELTTMITGPLAGQMLADMGADVVKVENPKGGDPFRNFRGGTYSGNFIAYNRNKRSVALDLRSEEGKQTLIKLLEKADVLIENFRPGVMRRLGLSYSQVAQINDSIIFCSITGFGSSGPYKDRPAYDAVGQSIAGITGLFVDPDNPVITGPTIADNVTGMNAAYGILSALYRREKTGFGAHVEVNMLESAVAFIPDPFANLTFAGIQPDPYSRVRASQSYALKCSDAKLLAVHMSIPDKFWLGALSAFGIEELATDDRFDERQKRIDGYEQLREELQNAASNHSREHWMGKLEAADVPFAPINSLDDVIKDPQVEHLKTFFEVDHPTEGKITQIRRPVTFGGLRDSPDAKAPPTLDEHGEEIRGALQEGGDWP